MREFQFVVGDIVDAWENSIALFGKSEKVDGVWYRDIVFLNFGSNFPIFCVSQNLNSETIERMQEDSLTYSGEKYDVCIPITDPRSLMKALAPEVAESYGVYGVIPSSCGPVDYVSFRERPKISVKDVEKVAPSPYVKDIFFESQAEARFVFARALPANKKGFIATLGRRTRRWFGEPIYL